MGKGSYSSIPAQPAHDQPPVAQGTSQVALSAAKGVVRFVCNWAVAVTLLAACAASTVILATSLSNGTLFSIAESYSDLLASMPTNRLALGATVGCLVLMLALWASLCKKPVYLMDFYTFLPPEHLSGDCERFVNGVRASGRWTKQSSDFMAKVVNISGVGSKTYVPEEVAATDSTNPTLKTSWIGAKQETEMVLFTSIQKLLDKVNISAREIDAVIVNCTSYNPVPSLSAAVINHFGMKPTVLGYTLSGMGCAASVIAVDLARELLQNHPNMRVLIAGTENITSMLYFGNVKSMLITNCIFRMGGVAAVLSNRRSDGRRAKYSLEFLVRIQLGSDQAYGAVQTQEDDDGLTGIKIGKELMSVAGRALKMNITRLAPLVPPLSEKIFYACNVLARKVFKAKVGEYTPDFGTAIQHFAIHPGGKAVIDTVSKALSLRPEQSEPCCKAFERFGNTSSSSTWYAWAYAETEQGVKRGDRLWQLAFGSGFKCNSAVWRARKNIREAHDAWTDTPSC